MKPTIEILFATLRTALFAEPLPDELFINLSSEQWTEFYRLAAKQGVLAIVYDVVSALPKEQQPPRALNIQWAVNSDNIQHKATRQRMLAIDLSSRLSQNGIRVMVLKGLGLSCYYPNPLQRECGDFDCYLFDDYVRGMETTKQCGALFEHKDYKHAQFIYKGLNVEMHKYFTSFRGGKSKHDLERDLHDMIEPQKNTLSTIFDSDIMMPAPTFNICFLIYHALFHFIFEGIKFRHAIDWTLYAKAEQSRIDWTAVHIFCDKYGLSRFAEALADISSQCFGIDIDCPFSRGSNYTSRIVEDILTDHPNVSAKRGWAHRKQFIKNTYDSRWRYELIDSSFWNETAKRTYYFLFSTDKL